MAVDTTGHILIRDGTLTTRATSTATVSAGSWFRLEAHHNSSAEVVVRLYTSMDSTTITETLTASSGTAGTIDKLRWTNSESGGHVVWHDDTVAGAKDWPGPYVLDPGLLLATMVAPAAATGTAVGVVPTVIAPAAPVTVTSPVGTGSAAGVVPVVRSTLVAPVASGSGVGVVPALPLLVAGIVGTGSAIGVTPVVRETILAPVGTGATGGATYAQVVLADTPVGYWKLDDPSGTTVVDSSTVASNGTYVNSPTLGVAGAASGTGTSVTFTGASSQYANLGTASQHDVGDVFSVEAFFKSSDSSNAAHTIISAGNNVGSNAGFQVRVSFGVVQITKFTFGASVISTISVTDGAWHHIICTKNGAAQKIWIDGVDCTGTITNKTCLTTGMMTIGAAWLLTAYADYANATLDEVSLYNYVLTPTQVAAHYAASSTLQLTPVIRETIPPPVGTGSAVGIAPTLDRADVRPGPAPSAPVTAVGVVPVVLAARLTAPVARGLASACRRRSVAIRPSRRHRLHGSGASRAGAAVYPLAAGSDRRGCRIRTRLDRPGGRPGSNRHGGRSRTHAAGDRAGPGGRSVGGRSDANRDRPASGGGWKRHGGRRRPHRQRPVGGTGRVRINGRRRSLVTGEHAASGRDWHGGRVRAVPGSGHVHLAAGGIRYGGRSGAYPDRPAGRRRRNRNRDRSRTHAAGDPDRPAGHGERRRPRRRR